MIRWEVFYTEVILVLTALVLLIVDLLWKNISHRFFAALSGTGLLLSFLPQFLSFQKFQGTAFAGFLEKDAWALFFQGLIVLGTLLTVVMVDRFWKGTPTAYPAEFLAILLFSAAGGCAVAGARELLTLYIGLETLTISSYLLAAYLKKQATSHEAGLKYFLVGAFSSALLLMGFSYLYGLAGTSRLDVIADRLAQTPETVMMQTALVLITAGLAFKISASPFHMWTPDVYEGAPTPITAYLSVVSKAVGFAAAARIFYVAFSNPVLEQSTVWLLGLLSALSMVWGNLAAIPQEGLKRMLAYSTIGQAGYLLLGVMTLDRLGATAMLYYLFLYLFANLGAFTAVNIVATHLGSDRISEMKGLAVRSPILAATFLLTFLSLAGVPPFAGFLGKWYLFSAAIRQGAVWLVVIGILFSVVSLYYYLQVIKQAYIRETSEKTSIAVTGVEKSVLWICMVFSVLLGVYAKPFMKLAQVAAHALIP